MSDKKGSTAKSRIGSHVAEVRRRNSGRLDVGIDGWLLTTAETPEAALHEISQQLRVMSSDRMQKPTIPKRFVDRVHFIAATGDA